MTETLVLRQPAFILQHRRYRETSLLLDLFTRDYGVVAVLARGVRKAKSRTAGVLLPFKALTVSYSGLAELKLLIDVESGTQQTELSGLALYCGFYINELVSRFCHQHDPYPEVFADYVHCLQQLSEVIQPTTLMAGQATPALMQLETELRLFELNLLQHIGLALLSDYDAQTETPIKPLARYTFQADVGVIEQVDGPVSGKTIQAMNDRAFPDAQTLSEAKYIMRSLIAFHLHGKPLKTRAILAKIYQKI